MPMSLPLPNPLLAALRIAISESVVLLAAVAGLSTNGIAQTSSTGAITGIAVDPSGAVVSTANVTLVKVNTGEKIFTSSDSVGRFGFLLLKPGPYQLCASKVHFAVTCRSDIEVDVTETLNVELRLTLATVPSQTEVRAEPLKLQTENVALGQVVDAAAVTGLPLATRNFAQIATLSPGVLAGVSNAGELGLGGTALSQTSKSTDGIFVHGLRSYENNWQLDGVSVSDVQSSGSASGGIPIPNPDSIEEFKVQTGLYDAAYGRYAGANVSVITKSGGNEYHGDIFEFFRNDALNANDFFRNRTLQPRPVLKQNQFGFALGGPFKKENLFFFGSYQGTRQVNGLAAGQARIACAASLSTPPLTDDRTPEGLGRLFGGMAGAKGGVAVNADGSNINPSALSILNFKLPNGTLLIPTPQTVDPSRAFAGQGFSSFSQPCHFDEDQFLTNVDYVASRKTRISARFFFADDMQVAEFPGNRFNPTSNIRGFASPGDYGFRTFSGAFSHAFSNTRLNEARLGFARTNSTTASNAPFKWSDVGVAETEVNATNEMPNLNIAGSVAFASAFPLDFAQNSFSVSDTLSIVHGSQAFRVGGSLTRFQDNHREVGIGSFVQFLSWPDFLLGLNAKDNGTGVFSNVFSSQDYYGQFDREYRAWEGSAFAQADYRVLCALTLIIGLRYERLGQFEDKLGRNSGFDVSKTDPNPPATGSLAGYIVASNFTGDVPPGVQRAANRFANDGAGQNTIAPRIGFAWQPLPNTIRLVLRAGYGQYFSRPSGQVFFQSSGGAPFALPRSSVGPANAGATFQSPFPLPFPAADSFPMFPPYSPTTATSILAVAPGFRSSIVQQFSLNAQQEPRGGWLLEVGYVGTRGTHLQRLRSLNQAAASSPETPIRDTSANTVTNIARRVPILGIPANSLQEVESEGNSWYNGLEASATKSLTHGLQFLGSYTFSKSLDTDGADVNSTSAGTALTLGNQNSPRQRWGRSSFSRTHRFVFSGVWMIPGPAQGLPRSIFGGWTASAIPTIQSGTALTVADANSANVFGISQDRAQLSGSCGKNRLVKSGSIATKLSGYFIASCFTTPPIIGDDGLGTGFGNSATGIVDGPGQANLDLALAKLFTSAWPREKTLITFRTEFYNALNHPQFANPDSTFTSPTFGVISAIAVNPRVVQFALKIAF
jgi:hypothetical protein